MLIKKKKLKNLPKKPNPPLCRISNPDKGCGILCPKCGSSMEIKYIFFGKKKCIHPECNFEM